jgi:hypothetical protein
LCLFSVHQHFIQYRTKTSEDVGKREVYHSLNERKVFIIKKKKIISVGRPCLTNGRKANSKDVIDSHDRRGGGGRKTENKMVDTLK